MPAVQLDLKKEKQQVYLAYEDIKTASSAVDSTLARHAEALHTQALHRLEILEKKMLKAEKKKYEAQQRQISRIKNAVFPGGTLQERVENILPYLSSFGREFIKTLYDHSPAVAAEFTVLTEQ